MTLCPPATFEEVFSLCGAIHCIDDMRIGYTRYLHKQDGCIALSLAAFKLDLTQSIWRVQRRELFPFVAIICICSQDTILASTYPHILLLGRWID